jgi:putative ABC transport system permease protein
VQSPASFAWHRLRCGRRRLVVAVTGVAFATVLMLMQLGFRDSLFASTILLHQRLSADLVLISPQSSFLATMQAIPKRRLYQALAAAEVESVAPVYIGVTYPVGWRNPYTGQTRNIYVVGVPLDAHALDMPELESARAALQQADTVLFDALGREEYGPIAADFRAGRAIETEVGRHRVAVRGIFELGTSFAVDGTLVTSDVSFHRLFPARDPGLIDIGLVRLRSGADAAAARRAIAEAMPADVAVLTKGEYLDREIAYWAGATPIGFVFAFGVVMGFVVGAVIVYQILFADVSDHLREYATLCAIGFSRRYLHGVILVQSITLAVLGYVPGLLLAAWLYRLTAGATHLPMCLDGTVAALVFLATVAMCGLSGLAAVRRLRSVDPAEVFQ